MDKVYFLTGAFPPQTGGEFYNYKLAEYLTKVGVANNFINLHEKRHYLRLSRIPIVGGALASLVLAILLHRCNGILVEDHYFSGYLFFTNLIQRLFKKGKIVTIVHLFYGYDSSRFSLKRLINRWEERIKLDFADVIITNSEYSKNEIISLEINPLKILVLPPGLDREKFKLIPRTELELKPKILYVGNCIPRKGAIYLIEAFSQIERGGFTLHIVGSPKKNPRYFKKLKSLVDQLQLRKDVVFHDGVDQEEIKHLYSSSDIFVLPSLKETFGIVLLEAMYYGLPIITTNISAIPELVTDGENGLLIPVANSQALAAALSKLIENPDLRRQMGERGRQLVLQSYHWDTTSSKFLSVIQNISV